MSFMVVSNSSRTVKEEFGGQYTEPIIMFIVNETMALATIYGVPFVSKYESYRYL